MVEPWKVNLKDWSSFGLPWFSGRCRYTSHFRADRDGSRYKLDLGKVNFCAEIWINGRLAAARIWAPYCADITEFIEDGENEITVVAANLAGNERRHMLVDEGEALGWNRYWNEDNMDRDSQNYVSGLLGPVRLMKKK
ncbi:glycosylhydrolase-like jelly roll fold domain-containing protein [Lachnospiraceae bacterium 54-53]